jgi:hypothetical protein
MAKQPAPCVAALRLLAEGRLDEWNGLPAGCTKDAAESAVGPSERGPDGVTILDGTPTAFRRYPAQPAAPHGVQVWLRDDVIFGVEIASPRLSKPPADLLGPPEAKERSGIGSSHMQWIYARRGLVLHVQNITNSTVMLYAFAPCTLAQFRTLPWGRVEIRRVRR